MIKNLSNTQKKILAGIITITFPIWMLVLPLVMLVAMIAILYALITATAFTNVKIVGVSSEQRLGKLSLWDCCRRTSFYL